MINFVKGMGYAVLVIFIGGLGLGGLALIIKGFDDFSEISINLIGLGLVAWIIMGGILGACGAFDNTTKSFHCDRCGKKLIMPCDDSRHIIAGEKSWDFCKECYSKIKCV